MLRFPVLIGDIGGTNARFAVVPAREAGPIALPRLLTGDFDGPAPALATALASYPGPRPEAALLAIAAPVQGAVVPMTNTGWVVDCARVAAELGLRAVALMNDYVPVAIALAELSEEQGHLVRIGPALPAGGGPRVVLGPGTGLGAAALVPVGRKLVVVPTEAGHVEFGPENADEAALWAHVVRVGGRITAETLLSGPGLARLYRALAALRGAKPRFEEARDIDAAGQGGEPLAAEALNLFARLLGRFAGDLALIFGATGGVFLGSGIAPRMIGVLNSGGFRAAFERKQPHDALMRRVPTFVVTHPEPALHGLGMIAADEERFVFEAHGAPA